MLSIGKIYTILFCRRNDVLLNKQTADQKGGTVIVAIEDEKNRKFSAAVVEYGKVSRIVLQASVDT